MRRAGASIAVVTLMLQAERDACAARNLAACQDASGVCRTRVGMKEHGSVAGRGNA